MAKETVLMEAERLIGGDRQRVYGSPKENWERTARMASAITGIELTASDCVKVMLAVKLARLTQTPKHRDSIVDGAAYFGVLGEVEGV